jgi:N-acetylglucosamine-6-phosphate deacetylase
MQLLTAPQVVADGRLLAPGWVLCDDTVAEYGHGAPPGRVTEAATGVVDLPDGVLTPGLVDMQINGAFGVDFAAADDEDWLTVARRLPSTGVTAFVPTLITAPLGRLVEALVEYRRRRPTLETAPGTAHALGLHLEGPFLADRRRGAHRTDWLHPPEPKRVEALLAAGDGALTYLTLAPERSGAFDAIRRLTSAGVTVAVGHTDADEPTVRGAADAGATLVTHLYNAQRPMKHRDPGTVGAALTDDRFTCGLIVDLFHVAATAVEVAFRCAGGRIALVTDAVSAMGMPPGGYELGGDLLHVREGEPPLRADGAIAGSALRMDQAVANVVRHCNVDLVTAVEAATRIPASAVGRDDLGRIAPGLPADLVWLDDELSAKATWVKGSLVWSRDDAGAASGAGVVR